MSPNSELRPRIEIERGSTDRPYGIYAAELAGVPRRVLERARNILDDLEGGRSIHVRSNRSRKKIDLETDTDSDAEFQLTFFDNLPHPVIEKLRTLDPNSLTPLEALNLLVELHKESTE